MDSTWNVEEPYLLTRREASVSVGSRFVYKLTGRAVMKKFAFAAMAVVLTIGYVASASADPQPRLSVMPSASSSPVDTLLAEIFKTAGQQKWIRTRNGPFSGSDVIWGSCSAKCKNGSCSKTCDEGYICTGSCGTDGYPTCGPCN